MILYIIISSIVTLGILILAGVKIKKTKDHMELFQKNSDINFKKINLLTSILATNFEKDTLTNSCKKLVNILQGEYCSDYCTLFIFKEEGFKIASTTIDGNDDTFKKLEKYICDTYYSLEGNGKIIVSDTNLQYPSSLGRNVKQLRFLPLKMKDILIGGLLLEFKKPVKDNKLEEEFFMTVAESVAVSLQNIIYDDKIYELANKDNLTKVYNRNFMDKFLNNKISSDEDFTLSLLDIDFFKKFNDTYGHDFGDIVLKSVAKFTENFIKDDMGEIFRMGGEEFIIYIAGDLSFATKKLNELRENIKQMILTTKDGVKTNLTVSIGITERYSHDSIKNLYLRADKGVYYSKEHGRDQVTVITGEDYNKLINEEN